VAAGLQALVGLPEGQTEADVLAAAARRGLAVEGLSGFAMAASEQPPALVVGYATPPEHAFTTALARFCAALAGTT
jgi:GntR family transcriptional regulator/MocR family aminotransferase